MITKGEGCTVLVGVTKLAQIKVRGVVQGVGFRPFVYRLAQEHKLSGGVRNTSGNVEIEIEGDEPALRHFLTDLEAKAPPMAHIEQIDVAFNSPQGYHNFEIWPSQSQQGKYQLVSPDIATCPDCRQEIFSPQDRRYHYPFTNCTNCGPRFTIIEDIPYDRPKTTMNQFTMCPACQREYDDPLDRRFHAQPNACPVCGPQLSIGDYHGDPVASSDVIKTVSNFLKEGKILALRGLGGFQLACDATNETAVNRLRERKRRPGKPFAVMLGTTIEIKEHCSVSPEEHELLESPQSPIVLLHWNRQSSSITDAVAPRLKYLGVMLPYTPLHHLLLRETGRPLVMTSGNLSEEPIAKDNDEARRRLQGIADYFLMHNREIYARYDDSVYFATDGGPQPVRRARGYAPYPIFLPFSAGQILACGAEEKNTFCLTKDEHAFISQHIGDMENEETLEHFENTIELYKRLFRIVPETITYDLHPEYLPTKYALEQASDRGLKPVPVQHHHAHIVSCTVENRVAEPVIGVAFDGTGYGADGTIWGGEFLIADWRSYQRAGHLEYVPLPGGSTAIKKPYRIALSFLFTLLGDDCSLEGLPLSRLDPNEVQIVRKQLRQGLNSPLTSSAGRLFDAVSALAGVRGEIDYEAQAAIELEMLARDETHRSGAKAYPFSIVAENGAKVVKLDGLIASVVTDLRDSIPVPVISYKFHRTMAQIIVAMCRGISQESGLKRVALSGGVFQNRLLFGLTTQALSKEGLTLLTHHLVPCNDGGISLGQAVIANFAQRS